MHGRLRAAPAGMRDAAPAGLQANLTMPATRTEVRRAPTIPTTMRAAAIDRSRAPDAAEMLRRLAPKGLGAVLALAGGEALEHCLALVRDGGRAAYPNGVEPPSGPLAPSD